MQRNGQVNIENCVSMNSRLNKLKDSQMKICCPSFLPAAWTDYHRPGKLEMMGLYWDHSFGCGKYQGAFIHGYSWRHPCYFMMESGAEGVGTVLIKTKYRVFSWPRNSSPVCISTHIWKEYSHWPIYYSINYNSEEVNRAQPSTSWQMNKRTAYYIHTMEYYWTTKEMKLWYMLKHANTME